MRTTTKTNNNMQYQLFESCQSHELYGVAEIAISYKRKFTIEDAKISSSTDIYKFLKRIYDPETVYYREEFFAIYLDRANQILGFKKIGQGNSAGVVACPKMIMQGGLKMNAQTIILTHNHPSGNLKPSEADRKLTQKVKEAGLYLEMPVLDHIIYTPNGYFSFADEGLI